MPPTSPEPTPQPTKPSAKIILDSISPSGDRLTTMQVTMHRFVLAEFNTHRKFSRNSASSRAIPTHKRIESVINDPAMPIEWGANKKGMQADEEIDEYSIDKAQRVWVQARSHAVYCARQLNLLNVHKQVVNRLLEPFLWHTVIVSSTEWENFFKQRCSPLAQPEIRAVADTMHDALSQSTPILIHYGDWHTPYIQPDESFHDSERCLISAARCARVSYLTQEGVRDIEADKELGRRLLSADPPHWSPFEHVARPCRYLTEPATGNFDGWVQMRHVARWELQGVR